MMPKVSNKSQSGVDLQGGDRGLCHFSILPHFVDMRHFSKKSAKNNEILRFSHKKRFF